MEKCGPHPAGRNPETCEGTAESQPRMNTDGNGSWTTLNFLCALCGENGRGFPRPGQRPGLQPIREPGAKARRKNREPTTDGHRWTRIRGEAPKDDHGFSLCISVFSVVKTAVGLVRSPAFRLGSGSARQSAANPRSGSAQAQPESKHLGLMPTANRGDSAEIPRQARDDSREQPKANHG